MTGRCTTGFGPHRTCLQALAEGWILTSDLCPRCTRVFMQALDRHLAPEEPLAWHRDYLERAL